MLDNEYPVEPNESRMLWRDLPGNHDDFLQRLQQPNSQWEEGLSPASPQRVPAEDNSTSSYTRSWLSPNPFKEDAVKAFLEREELIREERRVDRRVKVLEFRDDETTAYVILSHRWIDQEVNYDEMIGLAKMEKDDQDEVRQRNGYRKILDSCEQAKGGWRRAIRGD
ncbi:hypothetical protein J3A83DRAFT_4413306 [Scleroderma citrinum]